MISIFIYLLSEAEVLDLKTSLEREQATRDRQMYDDQIHHDLAGVKNGTLNPALFNRTKSAPGVPFSLPLPLSLKCFARRRKVAH
jgi:hypothetical protein